MKRFFLPLLLALTVTFGADARIFALVCGVSNYGSESTNLHQTSKDAKSFKQLLSTQTKDITLLTSSNVTKANLLEKLQAICNRAQKDDRIIFFFSGHGMKGAIYCYDGPLRYSEITSRLAGSEAKQKICYIDACFAGTAANAQVTEGGVSVSAAPGQAFFVSCRPNETSIESGFVGAGFFTQALLKGLQGKADKNQDKKVTVMELFKYLRGDVLRRSNNQQHPQLIAPESMYNVVLTDWNKTN